MKRAFILSPAGEIVSAIIPKVNTPTAFHEGEEFTLETEIDLAPYGTVPRGLKLRVLSHEHDTGIVDLELLDPPCGFRWSGVITLVPYETDDALLAIKSALQRFPKHVLEVV